MVRCFHRVVHVAMKVPSLFVWFKSTEWKFFSSFFLSFFICTANIHKFCVLCCLFSFDVGSAMSAFTRQRESHSSHSSDFPFLCWYFYAIFLFHFFSSTCLKTKRGCVNEYYFVACMHTKDINYRIHFIYELSFIHIAFYVCLQTCVWEKERESQSRFE